MLFLFQDPLGDAHGLAYLYPQAALYREAGEGYADLTALAGEVREGSSSSSCGSPATPTPWAGPWASAWPRPWSTWTSPRAGRRPFFPASAPPGQGWEAAFVVTGFGVERKSPEGKREAVGAWREGSGWSGPQAFPRGSTATTGRWGSLTPSPPGTCAPFPRKGGLGPGGPLGHAPSGGRPRPPPRGPKGRLPGGGAQALAPQAVRPGGPKPRRLRPRGLVPGPGLSARAKGALRRRFGGSPGLGAGPFPWPRGGEGTRGKLLLEVAHAEEKLFHQGLLLGAAPPSAPLGAPGEPFQAADQADAGLPPTPAQASPGAPPQRA